MTAGENPPVVGGFSAENVAAVRAARQALEASLAPVSRSHLVQVEQQQLMLQYDLDEATSLLQSSTLFDCQGTPRSWRLLQTDSGLEALRSGQKQSDCKLVFVLKREEVDELAAVLTSS
uniref:Uncharacterized protein n=1 Tax=Eutreptiella gymnastica TaxID=73025 RepID=A0A7S1NEU5_9EUGL|mmetsp:Transcript_24895/g.45122  ORF Transcript_24895/g.45122 Transcript_24895/m.45122 type:complete len:119 (+) Transcript_24895:940-1296(+)